MVFGRRSVAASPFPSPDGPVVGIDDFSYALKTTFH
jgi:hypothetical protein